jgi:hypothetical protein
VANKTRKCYLAGMDAGRKRVLAITAGILVARHLKKTKEDLKDTRESPRTSSMLSSASVWAERILRKNRWQVRSAVIHSLCEHARPWRLPRSSFLATFLACYAAKANSLKGKKKGVVAQGGEIFFPFFFVGGGASREKIPQRMKEQTL